MEEFYKYNHLEIKKFIGLLGIFGFFVLAAPSCTKPAQDRVRSDTIQEVIQRGELRVGIQTQGPPFSFIDKNGKRTGSSVELAEMIAQEMGVKVSFKDYDWDGLIPALLSKKVDLLAADLVPSPKRALKVLFSEPFFVSTNALFTKKDHRLRHAEDFNKNGIRIAVILGTYGEQVAKRFFPNAEIKSYKGGGPIIIDAVLSGQADAGLNGRSSIEGQLLQYPQNVVTVLPEVIGREPMSFAFRPDDFHLQQWINLFFDELREDGRMNKNASYWIRTSDWKREH